MNMNKQTIITILLANVYKRGIQKVEFSITKK